MYQIWVFLDGHSDKCPFAVLGRVITQTDYHLVDLSAVEATLRLEHYVMCGALTFSGCHEVAALDIKAASPDLHKMEHIIQNWNLFLDILKITEKKVQPKRLYPVLVTLRLICDTLRHS